MFKITFVLLFFLALLLPQSVLAIYDPTSVVNNKFGIHITQEADLQEAAKLVNSSGGNWGYVTVVVRNDERDSRRWQNVFNQMRRLHIIPIVRVATIQQDGGWAKPSVDEIDGWVDFLSSLNWPTQNMYVVIGNEPNHSKEWAGEISPQEYAEYLNLFTDKAKAKSQDFFILPAALDFSAKSDGQSFEATKFVEAMLVAQPDIFERIDGWNSHSYPNPGFSGSERSTGKGTIASYAWELSYLKGLGVSRALPVFITETGWAHNMEEEENSYLDSSLIGPKLKYASAHLWNDSRIVAVTPFILNYQDPPFDMFSWKKKDGGFYPFVEDFKSVSKVKGEPIQKSSGEIITAFIPPYVEAGVNFTGALFVKNTGQSIWNEEELLLLGDLDNNIEITKFISFPKVEPGEKRIALFEARAPIEKSQISGNLTLFKGDKMITNAWPYNTNSYIAKNVLGQILFLRNGISSALWLFRINILGF